MRSVLVETDDSPQMKLYALSALGLFDCIYEIDTVSMTNYRSKRSSVNTFTIPKEKLYKQANQILNPTTELSFNGGGGRCQFCRAKVDCREKSQCQHGACQAQS